MANDTNAYDMWHKLSRLYQRKNALKNASLMSELVRLKYIDSDSIIVHISTFMGLGNQLASTQFPLDDALQALLLLCTLLGNWKNLILSISAFCQ